jgi:hypothetical protein
MRILEFTPPSFLSKARLISKAFKGFVDQFTSIYVNCRKENFGHDMPPPPPHLTEQQYNELLGGKKGCVQPGCADKRAIRTHWSWFKRWCWNCWKEKIEREDRAMKSRGLTYGRATLTKMLECIPVGMHDSFLKPHDFIDGTDAPLRGAPRLYRYYLTEDIDQVIKEFESLNPAPYVENPNYTQAERSAALAAHQELMDGLEAKRTAFFAERKAKNDEHMAQVVKIEAGIRMRRANNRDPYDKNRNARRKLFSQRAQEDLPHIDPAFVKSTAAYKAATRIFRDPGTERGWLTLKPKIIAEWEVAQTKKREEESDSLMDITGAGDARPVERAPGEQELLARARLESMRNSNESVRRNTDPYARLQHYQSQLQRLEENKPSRRLFPPHGFPGSDETTYFHGLPPSHSLFPSPSGNNSTFSTSVSYNTMAMHDRRSASTTAGPLGSSQPLGPGNLLAPPQFFSQPTPLGASSNFSHSSIQNPSTQITVNSLLGPSTPTMPRARSPPQPGPST